MKNFNQFILTLLAAGLLASCSLTEEPTSFVNRKSFYKNESQCIACLLYTSSTTGTISPRAIRSVRRASTLRSTGEGPTLSLIHI